MAVPGSDPSVSRDQRFVNRMHHMRTLGLVLGTLPIASVLYENGASAWTWAALVFNDSHGRTWPGGWRVAVAIRTAENSAT
jgi:MASE2 domain-containing protein